jgi:hypothetical protein
MQVANDLWSDGYHNLDDFRKKYHEKYHKDPYVSPVVRCVW